MSNEFKNEVFSSHISNSPKACGHCRDIPALVLTMLNPQNGRTVRMFKCDCGEQTWTEDKK